MNNLQKRIGKLHQEKTQLEQSLGVLQRKVMSIAGADCTQYAAHTIPCLIVLQLNSLLWAQPRFILQTFHCCSR